MRLSYFTSTKRGDYRLMEIHRKYTSKYLYLFYFSHTPELAFQLADQTTMFMKHSQQMKLCLSHNMIHFSTRFSVAFSSLPSRFVPFFAVTSCLNKSHLFERVRDCFFPANLIQQETAFLIITSVIVCSIKRMFMISWKVYLKEFVFPIIKENKE